MKKIIIKLNEWFAEPLGNTLPSDSTSTELKKPQSFYENLKSLPGWLSGKWIKGEPTQGTQNFDSRGPRSFSKAVMHRSGRRVTSQKKK